MTSNPLYGRRDDMVNALLGPKTKATHNSVADLFGGIGGVNLAASVAGLEVVYAYEPDATSQRTFTPLTRESRPTHTPPDSYTFDHVPPFRYLIASLPAKGAWADTFGFVLRFLRVRRPAVAIMHGALEADPGQWSRVLGARRGADIATRL